MLRKTTCIFVFTEQNIEEYRKINTVAKSLENVSKFNIWE